MNDLLPPQSFDYFYAWLKANPNVAVVRVWLNAEDLDAIRDQVVEAMGERSVLLFAEHPYLSRGLVMVETAKMISADEFLAACERVQSLLRQPVDLRAPTRAELRALGTPRPTHQRRRARLARVADKSRLDVEIARVDAAMRRHDAAVEEMQARWSRQDPGGCCVSCWGGGYADLCDQAKRTAKALVSLLEKRGTESDLRRASEVALDWLLNW